MFQMIRICGFLIFTLTVIFALSSCHGGEDRRQMYVDHMKSMEGRKFHDFPALVRTASFATQRQLTNGNTEYRYDIRKGECVDVFEVDPKTDAIVKAWFIDGSISACKWYP